MIGVNIQSTDTRLDTSFLKQNSIEEVKDHQQFGIRVLRGTKTE